MLSLANRGDHSIGFIHKIYVERSIQRSTYRTTLNATHKAIVVEPDKVKSLMVETDEKRSVRICNGLRASNVDFIASKIAKLGKEKRWKDVLYEVEQANLSGNLSYAVLSEAIGAMGRSGRPKEAISLLKDLQKMGKPIKIFAHNSVIQTKIIYCAEFCFRFSDVTNEFDGSDRFVISNAYSVCGMHKEALRYLKKIQKEGIVPTMITYNIVLSSFSKSGSVKFALKLCDDIRKSGLQPDKFSYSALMNACANRGDVLHAKLLFKEMEQSGVSPCVRIYNAAINACAETGDWKWAKELFTELLDKKLEPTVIVWTCFLDALGRGDQLEFALEMFNDMKISGIFPNASTYNCLISAASNKGQIEIAEGLLKEMEENGLAPDVYSFSALINGFAVTKELDRAEAVFKVMCERNIRPNTITYSALLKACTSVSNLPRALRWLNVMQKANLKTDLQTWSTVIYAAHEIDQIDLVDCLYSEALNCGAINPYRAKGHIENCSVIVDLHMFNVGMALAAIRYELQRALNSNEKCNFLGIITGKGIRNGNPVVKNAVTNMLKARNIDFQLVEGNEGRIIVNIAN